MMDPVAGLRQVVQNAPVPELRMLQAKQRAANERLDRISGENTRRFQKAGERFTLIQDTIKRCLEAAEQQALTISKTLASLDGKRDALLNNVLHVKAMSRLSGRVEALKRPAAAMAHRH